MNVVNIAANVITLFKWIAVSPFETVRFVYGRVQAYYTLHYTDLHKQKRAPNRMKMIFVPHQKDKD